MALHLTRSDAEINKLMNDCVAATDEGVKRYPGESYEEGIYQALLWATGQTEDYPYEIDD